MFEITDERTELWVEKYVLKNENRIIFVIQDLENHYLGQIGLAGINGEQRSAEIDAVVRAFLCKKLNIYSETVILFFFLYRC